MKEVMHAEEAIKDLEERGFRSRVARVVVRRLAERMADEIASKRLE